MRFPVVDGNGNGIEEEKKLGKGKGARAIHGPRDQDGGVALVPSFIQTYLAGVSSCKQ